MKEYCEAQAEPEKEEHESHKEVGESPGDSEEHLDVIRHGLTQFSGLYEKSLNLIRLNGSLKWTRRVARRNGEEK